jgi:hypothetical protein
VGRRLPSAGPRVHGSLVDLLGTARDPASPVTSARRTSAHSLPGRVRGVRDARAQRPLGKDAPRRLMHGRRDAR